ncbi:bifunctional methylenetetrahydrofolate dehydrogenase/methenyltetrahydrofolate cyclohydrolase FolD [Aquicella lusitana]|uniref:Bifunctional protein FolD n=1 Tax=Aquicella lusitana TaxID=254246 RepID=A0A370GD52_9COXI|nr:bifunctional methylenetetrahydrofolate dehydrogenase/methenyltetrahydrofolate cyclohydrolase FolD [Aquicella lusitana]RDI40999.1 methylenetetrahydrofolate dehydrogenase (NADP+)/methenyltetrahydrofolate cyclohydrolase [Aquicella lusitana]VVC73596.1 Bifunctional protein FolD protein [Aquicella lusitana]
MTAQLIDGKAVAAELKAHIREQIKAKIMEGKRPPGLAVILVGEDPASSIYVRNKREACEQVGIHSIYHHLSADIKEEELIALIHALNHDKKVDGILLQLPLPRQIDANKVLDCIDPQKDVDGFHAYNLGRLAQRRPLLRSCTPYGIMLLLDHIHQQYKGKHAVIVGASNIVGRPMALELLIAGSTVTVCHRFTHDLPYFVRQADILVSAVGKPEIIKGEWIKEGATVVDVGITRREDGSLAGDVEFEAARKRAAWITPVPGGVGPMTVAVLLHNTLRAAGYINSHQDDFGLR